MIVGSTIHFLIAYTVGKKHSLALTAQTKRIQDQLDEEERLRNEQHEREKDQGSTNYIIFLHGHNGPENLKKSRPKKFVKSKKSFPRKNFFA